ncbi:biopolymer transporter ExbD [bacterium]|nr:biopolymer transporter ExbD [bacterium]
MAFKAIQNKKEKIELISLIDVLFILLVFFLVTSFVIRLPLQERNISIPTPEQKSGRAQIVIQLTDGNSVFWLDENASFVVKDIENRMGYMSRDKLNKYIVNKLIKDFTMPWPEFEKKLNGLIQRADRSPGHEYFVMIRCPDYLPYIDVVNIIARLKTQYSNINYGCVSGTIDDIKSCRSIRTVTEIDKRGRRRKNIQIDF